MSRSKSKQPGISHVEFAAAVSRGDLEPLYLFLGPERYLRREAIDRLVETVDEAFRAFNVDTFSAAETSLENILDVGRQLPMMAARRLVVVTQPDSIREGSQEHLEDYLKNPAPEAVVVFVADSIDLRRKSATALSKACTVVRFDEVSEQDAVRWAESRVRALGSRIERTALGALVDLAGTDLSRLAVEIEKLTTFAGRGQIGLPDVQALVVRAREHEVWDLTDAIVAADRKRAMRVLARQLEAGEEPLGLLGMLASTYRKMLLGKELMARRAPASEVQAAVKLPPWKMGEFNGHVRHTPVEKIVYGLRRMAEVDLAIKSSVGTPRLQLEVLVCELTS
jgi:DNA polymerase-3 subunit delta